MPVHRERQWLDVTRGHTCAHDASHIRMRTVHLDLSICVELFMFICVDLVISHAFRRIAALCQIHTSMLSMQTEVCKSVVFGLDVKIETSVATRRLGRGRARVLNRKVLFLENLPDTASQGWVLLEPGKNGPVNAKWVVDVVVLGYDLNQVSWQ